MDDQLSIGEFAALSGLSRSALRFYDRHGLLAPRRVDAETGYRFYTPAQLEQARLIMRLRAAELPIARLREYLTAGPDLRAEILDRHAHAFRARVLAVERALGELRAHLASDSGWCVINRAGFAAAISQMTFAMADPADRPDLARIWLETREQSLRLVSTDSFRLAVRDLVPGEIGGRPIRAVIAAEQLGDLTSRRDDDARELTLRQGDDEVLTAIRGGVTVPVGGSPGDFPDYELILSGLPAGEEAVLARHDLEAALGQLPSSAERVGLRFGASGLVLEGDGSLATAGGEWPGADLTVWLDRGFLADAVAATVGPDVSIEAIDPLHPVTLRSADTGTFSVLTMPIRP